MQLKFNKPVYVYPWINNDQLMIDIDEEPSQGINLVSLFSEYMSYFRLMDGTIPPDHHKEIMNAIALLRFIARDMETELEGNRG